jgi:hypothetical protein
MPNAVMQVFLGGHPLERAAIANRKLIHHHDELTPIPKGL